MYRVSSDREEDSVAISPDVAHRRERKNTKPTLSKGIIQGEMTSHHTGDDIDEIESAPLIKPASPFINQTNDPAPTLPDMEPEIESGTTPLPLIIPMPSMAPAEFALFSETPLSINRRRYLRGADSTDPTMSGGLGPSDSADVELGGPDFLVCDAAFDAVYDANDDVA